MKTGRIQKPRLVGPLRCRMVQLTRSLIETKSRLLTHVEALEKLSGLFSFKTYTTNIAIASNYPWVLRQEKEIPPGEIDNHKVLILPATSLCGRQSVSQLKQMVLHDMRAHFNEIVCLLHTPINFKVNKLPIEYFISRGQALLDAIPIPSQSSREFLEVKDDLFKCVPNPNKFKTIKGFIQHRINNHIMKQDALKNLPMRGNVKMLSLLQGKNSIIRQAVPRRILGLRGQILLRPELKPNQAIYPHTWQETIGVYAKKLVDISSPEPIDEDCFIDLKHIRMGQKRDPAINLNAFSFHNSIAFTKHDNIYIGPGEIGHKNADFDGDTQTAVVFSDPIEVLEIDLNILPQYNMKSAFTCRVMFTEAHALIMHQRRLPEAYPHRKLYDFVREHEINEWKNNSGNIAAISRLKTVIPNIENYIEPTKTILANVLSIITQRYGSREGYNFFVYINNKTLELSNGKKNDFHCEDLKGEYFFDGNIHGEAIIRCCMSGAKGSINSLEELGNKLLESDGTTHITPLAAPFTKKGVFEKLYKTSQSMASASKSVQTNGHAFFKSNIGYNHFSFDNSQINYHGKVIRNNLDILSATLLMNPLIAKSILHV